MKHPDLLTKSVHVYDSSICSVENVDKPASEMTYRGINWAKKTTSDFSKTSYSKKQGLKREFLSKSTERGFKQLPQEFMT